MTDTSHTIAHEALNSFITRIERLREEKKAIAADEKEVFAEAKSQGFDPKIMKKALKIREMDEHKRAEEEALLNTYLSALGVQTDMFRGAAE